MQILCRHIQVYTLGRLSIDGFSFERVAQFNLEWIFSKLDSGFQSLVGFRILISGFRIPEAKNSWIPESGFPYMGRRKDQFALYIFQKGGGRAGGEDLGTRLSVRLKDHQLVN